MAALGQQILGEPVHPKVWQAIGFAILGVKTKEGDENEAVIRGRFVDGVMDHFDYGAIEKFSTEIHDEKAGLVEVQIKGLKFNKWSEFAMKAGASLKKAFPAGGKMNGDEQAYYDKMPLEGLDGLFDDDDTEMASEEVGIGAQIEDDAMVVDSPMADTFTLGNSNAAQPDDHDAFTFSASHAPMDETRGKEEPASDVQTEKPGKKLTLKARKAANKRKRCGLQSMI